MSARQERVEALFNEALILSPPERKAFLAGLGASDATLHRHLEELLKAHSVAGGFLPESPVQGLTIKLDQAKDNVAQAVGETIGRYKLLERVGEGGCGVVYVAEQTEPVRRRVALKVIKPGMDSKSVIARFEAERQALAMMDHPNIAKVLDAGTTENGRPYFVMELVRGIRITDYCDQNRLSAPRRLDLFIQICNAVQHAHQKGIIHRDLKPSNILVTVNDGMPVPKVIDFGIAKATEGRLTDLTVYTELHQFIGTPAYMSPEQAEMTSLDIDTRSDIYSLGVLLYELLTGRTPFDPQKLMEAGLDEIRRTIREVEPPRPSTRLSTLVNGDLATVAKARGSEAIKLVSLIRGDLDWIVMKALEKDRTRRYDTANGFALDVKRFLGNEPVTARPPSAAYRFQKLVRRNKLAFAAAAAVMATLVLGLAASTWQAIRARREQQNAAKEATRARAAEADAKKQSTRAQLEKQRAETERQRANASELLTRKTLYAADMESAFRAFEARNYGHVSQLLAKYDADTKAVRDLRGWEWRYLWDQNDGNKAGVTLLGRHPSPAVLLSFSSDGKRLASMDWRAGLKIWDLHQCRELFSTNLSGGVVQRVTWSPDDQLLVTSGYDGLVRLWNAQTHRVETQFSIPLHAWNAAFSPDGKTLAIAGEQEVRLIDVETRQERKRISYDPSIPNNSSPRLIAFSPDQRTLAIACYGPSIKLWDWQTEREVGAFETEKDPRLYEGIINDVMFSRDGRILATAGRASVCTLWDVAALRPLTVLTNHNAWVHSVDFSSDGNTLATRGDDQSVRLWDVATKREIAVARDFSGALRAAFSPDGRSLATVSEDGSVKLWALPLKANQSEVHHLTDASPRWARISPEHQLVSFGTGDGQWHLWDLSTESEIHVEKTPTNLESPVRSFIPGRRSRLFEYTKDKALRFRSIPDGAIEPFLQMDLGGAQVTLCVSENGRFAAAAGDGQIHVWEVATKAELHRLKTSPINYHRGMHLSPDGNTLIARGEQVFVWRLKREESDLLSDGYNTAIGFFRDGRFAAASDDGVVLLVDPEGRKEQRSFNGGYGTYVDFGLSPDGKRMVLAAMKGVVQIWDLETNRQVAALRACDHDTLSCSAAFLDEDTIASIFDSELRIWRAPSWEEIAGARRNK